MKRHRTLRAIRHNLVIASLICLVLRVSSYGDNHIELFSEGFENGISDTNWVVNEDRNPAGSHYFWGLKSDCFKKSGIFSAFCCGAGGTSGFGRPCGNNYARDMDSWLISRQLDFTNLRGMLEFWYVNDSESSFDYFRVYIVAGLNNYLIFTAQHETADYPNAWQKVTIDLSAVPGLGTVTNRSDIQIAFNFSSDFTNSMNGTYLDDIIVSGSVGTDVELLNQVPLPTGFSLDQNYPNPFNPVTDIRLNLPKSGQVKLVVYNILGAEVATLVDEVRPAGVHRVTWNGSNNSGQQVATGVYLYRLTTSDFSATKKMILLK